MLVSLFLASCGRGRFSRPVRFSCARPASGRGQVAGGANEGHAEARALLDAQVAAWNRHDLDGFLAGYRKDEHVVFVTPEGSSRGYAGVGAAVPQVVQRPREIR